MSKTSQRSPALDKLFNSHVWRAAQHKHNGPSKHRIQRARIQHGGRWPQHQLESAEHVRIGTGFKPV